VFFGCVLFDVGHCFFDNPAIEEDQKLVREGEATLAAEKAAKKAAAAKAKKKVAAAEVPTLKAPTPGATTGGTPWGNRH